VTLKAGARLRGTADTTEVVVVRGPAEEIDLRCGGHPMVPLSEAGAAEAPLDPDFAGGTQLGKRYVHEASGLELLCTKPGQGSLSIGADVLPIKEAKPLPSSD
jgi:hypothetical protein